MSPPAPGPELGPLRRGLPRAPFWLLGVFFAASVMLDLFSVVGWAGSDASPSTLAYALAVPFTAFGIALLVELGFRKGTAGPNPHGPDPLAGAGRAS